jgi:endonuclease/exonuclease/phosphatase family metal-dependent hydrolase
MSEPTPRPVEMPRVRVATFNVENLFSRPEFADRAGEDALIGTYRFTDAEEGRLARRIVEAAASDDKRQLTAHAIAEARADVVALQEVDDRDALELFHDRYLDRHFEAERGRQRRAYVRAERAAGRRPERRVLERMAAARAYPWRVLVEGNDGRGIDVGLLSRLPVGVRSHAHRSFEELGVWSDALEKYREKIDGVERRLEPSGRVFRRDCLEVDLHIAGRALTLFICHFKSMSGGRERTRPLRLAEAAAVKRIVSERFGAATPSANWIICGDLNDYYEIDGDRDLVSLETGHDSPSALSTLLEDWVAVDIGARLPAEERWTSYYGREDAYTCLDYLLLSPALAAANPGARPEIIRTGQPYRATRYGGPRHPRVGWDRPKASDHCPVVVELALP